MEKTRKKQIKNIIALCCVVVLVALLAAMPLLAENSAEADGPKASILEGTASRNDIATQLLGGGTLSDDGVEITVPSGVMLTEFLVENGDTVKAGDPLAAIDRVSVMTAITQVQETLDHLEEELEDARDQEVSDKITAQAGGKVKIVYAGEGDSVRDVMLEHGALAVLSLDSLMAVELTSDAAVTAGDSVDVAFEDGTTVTGRVESALGSTVIVTIPDEDYQIGTEVRVTGPDGAELGTAPLQIHSAWKATAFSGTVKDISVKENDTVSAGKTLLTLEDTDYTAEFELLSQSHREYEALMLELFGLYQSETLTAPCDGVVSGVSDDSVLLLAAGEEEWTLSLLANAPNGDDETTYSNYLGKVAAMGRNGWALLMNPTDLPVTDYKELSGLPTDEASMTEVALYVPDAPVYELIDGQWQQIEAAAVRTGDVLLFAGDSEGNFVWTVRVKAAADNVPTQPTTPTEPTVPSEPVVPTEPTVPTDPGTPAEPTVPTEPTTPSVPTTPTIPSVPSTGGSWSDMLGGMGQTGSYPQSGAVQEEEFQLYSLEESTVLTVTPQDTMTLSVSIDQQDMASVSLGQTAEITVDALKGQVFTGTVTNIGTTGANSGGSSKFTLELTLPRGENMLSGMNATAAITLSVTEQVLTIPVEALSQDGSKSIVYTSCDPGTGTLGDPVVVETGISDGQKVQILSGLEEGDTFHYAYYDTLELSTAPEQGGLFG